MRLLRLRRGRVLGFGAGALVGLGFGAGALGGFGLGAGAFLRFALCGCFGFGAGALLGLAAGDLRVESYRLGDLELGRLERLGLRFRDDRERGARERRGLVLEQTELDAPDLAARRLRKLVDELDHSRVLVRCRHAP